MKKPSIPSGSTVEDKAAARAITAIKVNLDVITGAVGGELNQLPATATLTDVITTMNAIIQRLNGSGK